jgi:hypothetical protein
MDFSRYGMAWLADVMWVECIECSRLHNEAANNVDHRVYVYQGRGTQAINMAVILGAIGRHEIESHSSHLLHAR